LSGRPIRWLHLSDLHLGCRGSSLWWTVKREFEKNVKEHARRLGAPHFVLITGDLAFKGTEYPLVDQFIGQLLAWLREVDSGSDPFIIPVPGNHDLVRPPEEDDKDDDLDAQRYQVLENFHQGTSDRFVKILRKKLWEKSPPDASFFDPLFGNYRTWFQNKIVPTFTRSGVTFHLSHFPGDFSLRLDLPDTFPFTIVGLNSAWMQYRAGDDFERRLQLLPEQFLFALPPGSSGGRDLGSLDGKPNLLLTHHPPLWLSGKACREFLEQVFLPDRFSVWLYGHMHELQGLAVAQDAGVPRYYFQSPSLFGLEHYGSENEERAIGYCWGQMSENGEVRVWPLERRVQGGVPTFVCDQRFKQDDAGAVIRPLPTTPSATTSSSVPRVDLTDWLKRLCQQTQYIEISGIGSGVGKVQTATQYPIEQLYTPLGSHEAERGREGESNLATVAVVSLPDLLPRHDRLLIEGDPGCGKTTFLWYVASMLARDELGVPCPAGGSWSAKYLGSKPTDESRIPIFLKLSGLASILEKSPIVQGDDRERLLDLLDETAHVDDKRAWRHYWRGLIERGEGVLLLDGLDEVADPKLRARMFTILQNAHTEWKACPIVVTSRPFLTEAFQVMGFHRSTIEPFGDEEIKEFIKRWVKALYGGIGGAEVRGEYRSQLEEAIIRRPEIRRMARNPVMLTCLAVVHWNESKLPEGRARVYRAVIRWLIGARSEQRKAQSFNNEKHPVFVDEFVEWALARLALKMMGPGKKGAKTTIYDMEQAVDAIVPEVSGGWSQDLTREYVRRWLRFECEASGIIQEVDGNRIRFWHLTFQEFLAARKLAGMGSGDAPSVDWWPTVHIHLDDVQWRESIELLPGCLYENGGGTPVSGLISRVLELRKDPPTLVGDAWIAGIVGRLLSTLEVYGYKPQSEIQKDYQQILDRSMEVFTVEGAKQVPIETRIEAAEALGRGGDPRLRDSRRNFIMVPDLNGLELGKYPVTVEEYRHFVDAGGYGEKRYWDDEGWSWRNSKEGRGLPGEWEDQLQVPNRPVVGVSWYEARAFCRWLSEQWKETVRLPTSEEREKSATPGEGEYPWGRGDPTPELANYDGNVKHPTPVGVYPLGNGPYGHCDLAGNVLEWCEDLYSGDSNVRVLRGGSWGSLDDVLRCSKRGFNHPTLRNDFLGFRCVRILC